VAIMHSLGTSPKSPHNVFRDVNMLRAHPLIESRIHKHFLGPNRDIRQPNALLCVLNPGILELPCKCIGHR
jgi:hypothetical protein